MIDGIVDSTVIIHILRRQVAAKNWLRTQSALGVITVTWMELLYGAPGKRGQEEAVNLLNTFIPVYLTPADQEWAIRSMLILRLSHGVSINDCMIAAAAHRMQLPLFTHNLKDLNALIGPLAVKPYETN
jgi:predicted nucleic acid-binding protein